MIFQNDLLYGEEYLARVLKVSTKTLQAWRHRGRPALHQVGPFSALQRKRCLFLARRAHPALHERELSMESPKSQFSGSQPLRRERTMTGAATMTEPQAKPSESIGPLVPTGFQHISEVFPSVLAAIQAQAAAQHKNDRPAHSGDRNMRWAA